MESEIWLYIFLAGSAANGIWRFSGVILSSGIAQDSPIIAWVRAVSTALVAGLISRIVLFPPGGLADVDIAIRVGAFSLGVLTFFLMRRHLAAGIFAGSGMLALAHIFTS